MQWIVPGEVCLRGATQQWVADALPYSACDLERLYKKKTYGNWTVHTWIMDWQYLFDSMLSVELKFNKFIIIIVIYATIVIYACIIFISF